MDIALLNVWITFQKSTVKVDEIGNHITEWNDHYTCHATVSGENGREKSGTGVVVTEDSDIAFTIRYCKKLRDLVSTEYRILFRNEPYDITGIDHMAFKHKTLKIRCKRMRA